MEISSTRTGHKELCAQESNRERSYMCRHATVSWAYAMQAPALPPPPYYTMIEEHLAGWEALNFPHIAPSYSLRSIRQLYHQQGLYRTHGLLAPNAAPLTTRPLLIKSHGK